MKASATIIIFVFGILSPLAGGNALQTLTTSAGPNAVTVLVYNSEALPFSLMNVRRLVERLLSRVDTQISAYDVDSVSDSAIAGADYLILLGTTPWKHSNRIDEITTRFEKPVLAIGSAVGATAGAHAVNLQPISEQAKFVRGAKLSRGNARFTTNLGAIFPMTFKGRDAGENLAEAKWQGRNHVLAGRVGRYFWFSALPLEPVSGFIFSDIILDFYGVEAVGMSGILCLLDGVRIDGNPEALNRSADLLRSRNHPFALSIQMPGNGTDRSALHAFSLGLQHAQARGGRIVLGLADNPFWEPEADRPTEDLEVAGGTAQLVSGFEWAVENSFYPFGVRLPDTGFGENAAKALFPIFQVGMGIAQASDATASATFIPSSLTRVPGGGIVLPVGLWFQGPEPTAEQWDTARNLLRLRGTVLGVSIPVWETFQKTETFLQSLFALEVPFLDLADAPIVVSTTENLLLTSAASPVIPTFTGLTRIRTFDHEGKTISDDSRTLSPSPQPLLCPEGAAWLLATPQP
jgi:hypothetical protein